MINLTSEHDGVITDYNTTDAIIKPQFRIVRDVRKLNAVNLLEKLEAEDNFEEELKISDVDEMTAAIKSKLNRIINSIEPFKRV